MTWDFVSFFLNSEEAFIELNPNILETNIINIGLLVGILLYANKVSFSVGLENRQKEIVQTIENAQKDVVKASNYYYLAEKGLTQSLFWLQSWKALYEKDKVDLVNTKYKLVKTGLTEAFATTENLVKVFLIFKGFKIVRLSDYDFIEQVSIFYNAYCVIGLHGAGFANIIFCKKNALVMEVKSNTTNNIIKNLAISNKLRYVNISLKPIDKPIGSQFGIVYLPLIKLNYFLRQYDI